jgi:hypothetical protein
MSTILDPVGVTATTGLTDLTAAVGASKVRNYSVRVCNIGAADAFADLYLVDTADGSKNHYRARNELVPYQQQGSAADFEVSLLLTEGWKIQCRASAAATVTFSAIGVEDDA